MRVFEMSLYGDSFYSKRTVPFAGRKCICRAIRRNGSGRSGI